MTVETRTDTQEPVVAIDDMSDTYLLYVAKLQQFNTLGQEVEQLRKRFEERIGTNHVATIEGEPVFTWRPIERFQGAALKRDNPALAKAYEEPRVVYEINWGRLREEHPSLAEQYRSRQFRIVKE